MADTQLFQQLLEEVRAGDQEAIATLVRQCEPELRRAVRVRLTDPRLRRVLDSTDICQSVLANFFVRVTAGEFELERPEQLLHLLLKMARNKVLDQARRQQADKRDQRRQVAEAALAEVADPVPEPCRIVASQDLLAQVRGLLSEEERYLADQRGLGREWREIAREVGGQPDALRMKLSRALGRVLTQLGVEDINHV